ncbi:hypothetical protein [Gynuella sunshinyii]|uniref:Uncharacterized protein n=1 Tax=Gynuella sunshinyii YC6258 TaxID=1445510 RepID=A0A0C5VW94_9GAMM|nr:hypothetical protein [Gynuella sunshinyii]AJQ94704.1 hypothetical Protein YC6258_02666 [Gynuella sunshinyii YC6258]
MVKPLIHYRQYSAAWLSEDEQQLHIFPVIGGGSVKYLLFEPFCQKKNPIVADMLFS